MSTEAGVSMTGSPKRVALAATPLSGVIGIPASAWLGGAGRASGVAVGAGAVGDAWVPGFRPVVFGVRRGASTVTGGVWLCAFAGWFGCDAVWAAPGVAASKATAV